MKTVHNERLKLSATFLNGVAIAGLAIGGFTPAVQAMRAPGPPAEWSRVLITAAVCFCGSVILHFAARSLLRGLRE